MHAHHMHIFSLTYLLTWPTLSYKYIYTYIHTCRETKSRMIRLDIPLMLIELESFAREIILMAFLVQSELAKGKNL